MSRFNELDALVENENGYLRTAAALKSGVSKPTVSAYVKERKMERVAHGIYLSADAWPDELYQLYLANRRIIYSHETALFLRGLMEREPRYISVTVQAGYNATHLRRRGIRVHQAKMDTVTLGAAQAETNFGNFVRAYDMERTICDIIRCKNSTDVQIFQYAMKEYMASNEKNLNRLMEYARIFRIEAAVRTYTEVML